MSAMKNNWSRKPAVMAALLLLGACATTNSDVAGEAAAPQPPSAPVFALGDILGAEPAELQAALGEPDLARREGNGEFRRYSLSTCTLIIILYPDDTGVQKTAHVDAAALRSDDGKPDLDACLAAG